VAAPVSDGVALANGQLAGAGRNGQPVGRFYRYRGKEPMAADPRFKPCGNQCGRRIQVMSAWANPELCAVCRGAYGAQRGGQ
jgi:hypothetical protein